MKKVLFFDMYQTLVDTQIGDKKEIVESAYKEVFSDYLIKSGIGENEANNFQVNYKKLQDDFYTIHNKETDHHDFKKLLSEAFSTCYKINIDEITLLDLIYKYRKLTRGDTKLYNGVKEVLENLAKGL